MEQRIVEFIRALRAAGVRISLAESQDAMFGTEVISIKDAAYFRSALKTTLVKEGQDHRVFDHFFPLFFGSNTPPLQNIPDNMSPEDQQMLQQALQSLMGQMEALRQLLDQMMQGQPFSQEQLDQMGQQAGLGNAQDMYQQPWMERRMNRQSGLPEIQQLIDELLHMLAQMGMSGEALDQLKEMLQENAVGLSEQISKFVGTSLAQQMATREPDPRPDLMDVPFSRLGQDEVDQIRDEIRRLAARLRSRSALRQKRAKNGTPDPRKTMRANLRHHGVPLEIKYNTRHVKPSLLVLCDVSTSMRYCAEFLLTLIYELQDQVARTNSFIFIDDLRDISMAFAEHDSQNAIGRVLRENPPGHYNTDLGNSLHTFSSQHMSKVDHRTTVIMLGDGRNNYNDPRLDLAQDIQRRSRRLLWFCPEPSAQWGTGDSDMHRYAPLSNGVLMVNTLRDLANAVDKILADG
jgi:uncharacterized protein